jgi:hypothetical protein
LFEDEFVEAAGIGLEGTQRRRCGLSGEVQKIRFLFIPHESNELMVMKHRV